jgi:hypothetical protein
MFHFAGSGEKGGELNRCYDSRFVLSIGKGQGNCHIWAKVCSRKYLSLPESRAKATINDEKNVLTSDIVMGHFRQETRHKPEQAVENGHIP